MTRSSLRMFIMVLATAALALGLSPVAANAKFNQPHSTAQPVAAVSTLILSRDAQPLHRYYVHCAPGLKCNQIEFDWKAGSCVAGEAFEKPPVEAEFTSPTAKGVPAFAPCVAKPTPQSAHAARRDVITGANDVEYVPSSATANGQTITTAYWTVNGIRSARILPPQLFAPEYASTAPPPNELHVYLYFTPTEHLTKVKLRHGKVVIRTLTVPKGTNEIAWFGFGTKTAPPG
jgi:hypothetical protein